MSLGSHQRTIGSNQERFTPRWLVDALGAFATDAATSAIRPFDIGRERNLTPADDCLALDWRGFSRTWLNPPFDRRIVGSFVRKMCAHDHGILLLHVRTETEWFKPIWDYASGLLFLAGRIVFCKADGTPCTIENPEAKHYGKVANSGAPVALCAFGQFDLDVLAGCGLDGALVPLIFPRGILIAPLNDDHDQSWRDMIGAWLAERDEPARVADLYRVFAGHPKAKVTPYWREQIRKVLQLGAGRRVARDQWVAA